MIRFAFSRNKKLTIFVIITIILQTSLLAGLALLFDQTETFALRLEAGTLTVAEFSWLVAGLLAYVLVIFGLTYISQNLRSRLLVDVTKVVSEDYYGRLLSMPLRQISEVNINDYYTTLLSDVPAVINDYIMKVIDIIASLSAAIFIIIVALVINWIFALVLMGLSVLIIIHSSLFRKKLSKQTIRSANQMGRYMNELKSEVLGITEIKHYNAEDRFQDRYATSLARFSESTYEYEDLQNKYSSINTFIMLFLRLGAIITAILIYAYNADINLGFLAAAVYVTLTIFDPIKDSIEEINLMRSNKEYVKGIYDRFDKPKPYVNILPEFKESIVFKDVTFKYKRTDDDIISHVNMEILKNKKYLLQGASGTGKSVLFRLLTNSLDYDGEILIDGVDMYTLSEQEIFRVITYISNQTYLFSDTIRRNIDICDLYTDDKIMEMIGFVGLDDFMKERTLNLFINNESKDISSGEREKICLARALLRETDILLIDDACARLDYRSTAYIEDNVLALENKTVLYITHQLTDELISKFDFLVKFDEDHSIQVYPNTTKNQQKVIEKVQ